MDHELLTDEETATLDALRDLAVRFRQIIGWHPDMSEAVMHIHALQNMVLAQAAARAYPEKYRLLGGVIAPTEAR